MEIELKYKLVSHLLADKIWNDFGGDGIGCRYIGAYYDTPDMGLTKSDVIFRIRSEEEECVATLKWNSVEDFGLYEREEVNVNLGPNPPNDVSAAVFEGTKAFEVLKNIKDRLIPIVNIDFIRRKIAVNFQKSILELAIDEGSLEAGGRRIPLLEAEVELKKGLRQDLTDFGDKLSRTYSLEKEEKSKFSRAMEII